MYSLIGRFNYDNLKSQQMDTRIETGKGYFKLVFFFTWISQKTRKVSMDVNLKMSVLPYLRQKTHLILCELHIIRCV